MFMHLDPAIWIVGSLLLLTGGARLGTNDRGGWKTKLLASVLFLAGIVGITGIFVSLPALMWR
jgi:hypothetical protein